MIDSLCRYDTNCTKLHYQIQVVWRQTSIVGLRPANRCPTPLKYTATAAQLTVCQQSRNLIAAIGTRVTHTLWVVHGLHAQLQLRLIWVPARAAHHQLIVFCLDDFASELGEPKTKATAIALGDAVFAGRKPIAH